MALALDWGQRNFEVVLSSQVVNGMQGKPRGGSDSILVSHPSGAAHSGSHASLARERSGGIDPFAGCGRVSSGHRLGRRITVPRPPRKCRCQAYPAHRERQRNRILDAAEKLFVEHGIDRVTMAELTSASGVQPSTMYQYFSNKDDIVWAIVGKIMTKVSARSSETDANAKTALDKITAFLEYMAEELSDQRARVRFMAQFDAMYSHDWPVERLLKVEAENKQDGARRLPRLDPGRHCRRFASLGFGSGSDYAGRHQRRHRHAATVGVAGNKVELEYGQSVDKLFRETIRVILLGLRASWFSPEQTFQGSEGSKS